MKQFLLLAGIFLLASCVSIERNNPDDPGSTDYTGESIPKSSPVNVSSSSEYVGGSCDINDYGTADINGQIWLAKNWGCYVSGSKCYGNDSANCTKYGRLYDWSTAITVCPDGWHLPSDEEWDILIAFVGSSSTAGRYLKATSGWNSNGNGEDKYGFAALPGGYGPSDGSFLNVGINGYWWSSIGSTSSSNYNAYTRGMSYNSEGASNGTSGKRYLHSVRCVKD